VVAALEFEFQLFVEIVLRVAVMRFTSSSSMWLTRGSRPQWRLQVAA